MKKNLEKKFMKISEKEAEIGIKKLEGGPFGAVIVKNGKIIARGHNEVLKNQDPTCHAEMEAIRKACKKLKTFDLSDCEIYSSCEPCPMCFSAIHWAKIKKLFFGATKNDAKKIGFDDKFIYDVILGKAKKKQVKVKNIERGFCLKSFKEFEKMNKNHKFDY